MMKMKSDETKVKFDLEENKENEMSIRKAFAMLMEDIFAKARRYHTLLCASVIYWETINVKSLLKNFIIMNESTAFNLKCIPVIGTAAIRNKINEIFKDLNKYPFNPIIVKGDKVFITN